MDSFKIEKIDTKEKNKSKNKRVHPFQVAVDNNHWSRHFVWPSRPDGLG